MEFFIKCREIKKSFGNGDFQVEAIKNINLDVKKGEVLMIMGPSGSGKTTLLSILAGILNQDKGSCQVLGEEMKSLKNKTEFRGKNIGFVFQQFFLIPTISILENISVPLLLNKVDRKKAFSIALDFLKKIGLEDKKDRHSKNLSGGEMQRVAIARACVHRPKIMLCDEPTSFLDLERGKKIMELLLKMQKENGSCLIIVTHDPRILEYAHRIVLLEDGMIKNKDQNKKLDDRQNP